MKKIKENLLNVRTSATLRINEISKDLENNGLEIFKFGLGQSPFPVPENIIQELKDHAHKKDYLNVSGLLELRQAVAAYHLKKNKYSYSADDVIIGPGSKELIFLTQLIMDCDLLLPVPSWVSYEPQASIVNKKVHWLDCDADSNWCLRSEVLEETCSNLQGVNKLLILNSPNNPSGISHDNLKSIAEVALKHDVVILSDEIYAELDFSGEYNSISHFYPQGTIVSNGLSKWCGAGGWRIGTLIFPKELSFIKDTLRSVASETYTAVSAPIQFASIKAFTENYEKYLGDSRKILNCIAHYIFDSFQNLGIKCQKPSGGFYMLCDFSDIISISDEILDSKALCEKILKEVGFAMLPGNEFGINTDQLICRIAFVDFDGERALNLVKDRDQISIDFLEEACPKVVKGVNSLKVWIEKEKV